MRLHGTRGIPTCTCFFSVDTPLTGNRSEMHARERGRNERDRALVMYAGNCKTCSQSLIVV